MIGLRRGKHGWGRQIVLLVCAVMVLGVLVPCQPQPAGASTNTNITALSAELQSLYSRVPASEMGTLQTIYQNATSLTVYSQSAAGSAPDILWGMVFGGLDVNTLAQNQYGGNVAEVMDDVSLLLKDFAKLIYYGGNPAGASGYPAEIDALWNDTNADGATNQVTIQKILNNSSITEDQFSGYMLASLQDVPEAVASLLTSAQYSGDAGTILADIENGTLDDPTTNQFVQDCLAKALSDAATGTYAEFAANNGGAGWDFGTLINKGYRVVDGYIDIINGTPSEGEIILVKYLPLPGSTTPSNSGHNNGTPTPPPVPPPPASPSVFIARWPGHVDLNVSYLIPAPVSGQVPTSFVVPAPDAATLAAAKTAGLEERIYYYNEQYDKWVAMASYPQPDGSVLVENDGGYSNVWTEMYGVLQPDYTDITGYWAEDVINRMNGLALIEGYPIPGDLNPLQRTAGADREISRAEFVTVLMRALGCLPEAEQKLYGVMLPEGQEPDQILADWTGVPDWSRDFVAGAVYSGLASGLYPNDFGGNVPITRIQAAVIVSNFLKRLPNYKPADLSQFADAADVPDWARAAVADGVLSGYPNGTLAPNNPITRAESLVTILKMLRALGW